LEKSKELNNMGIFGTKNTIHLKVEGMTCGHCVGRVTKALEGVEGVKSAKVNLEKKDAKVELKGDKVDEDLLIKAVEEAGYKAKKP
jgi:copper ion binding protein